MTRRPSLADRLRGIVSIPKIVPSDDNRRGGNLSSPEGQTDHAASAAPATVAARPDCDLLDRSANVLGGMVCHGAEGAVIVIDRHYAFDQSHGREQVGAVVDTLRQGGEALATLRRAWPCRSTRPILSDQAPKLLFLDVETTGLAGGAGTQAFLVGCAVVEGDELLVRQFLLPGFEHERALLAELGRWATEQHTLVTFNGRSFDLPLIETRYLFHRLQFPLADAPHIDMLHASRRLWKQRPSIAGPPLDDDSCKLAVLERHLAGVHRVGDVPGFEIPSRFFRFVRSGDAFPLAAVLEHNRIDLVSLALVTARAIRLIEQGPSATKHPRECHGLARLYERAGMAEHAEASYVQASTLAARVGREPEVRAESLRRLAILRRRAGRTVEAAAAWAEILSIASSPALLRREAREALAIYHEHRSRDLTAARALVLDNLSENTPAHWRDRAVYRLNRIDRKLSQREKMCFPTTLPLEL